MAQAIKMMVMKCDRSFLRLYLYMWQLHERTTMGQIPEVFTTQLTGGCGLFFSWKCLMTYSHIPCWHFAHIYFRRIVSFQVLCIVKYPAENLLYI